MKDKIVLICALENGITAFKYFYKLHKKNKVSIEKVYTYQEEYVPNKDMFVSLDNIVPTNMLEKVKNINLHYKAIQKIKPDFIFIIGWSQLVNKYIINASKKGTIGFHTSKLPKDRGRSTLAWQIAEGYKDTALTMFYISEGIDNGDIIAQEIIKINETDYINDILKKINKSTYNLLSTYFPLLKIGKAPRIKQNENQATYRRLRTDKDSIIKWQELTTQEIYNLVRALAFPYPKAWTLYKGEKLKINKAKIIKFFPETLYFFEKPGTILGELKEIGYLIKTKDGIISINELEPKNLKLSIGEKFET